MRLEEIRKLRIAYVHDWLTGMRGGENVLEQMIEVLGPRDLYTLVSIPENLSERILECEIHPSWIQNLPFAKSKHQLYLPLFPLAIESFDLSAYDLIISTSHCVAKGVITGSNTLHWSYLHTPVRYAWEFSDIYRDSLGSNPLFRAIWALSMHYLRIWDASSANRVDFYSCNSQNVRKRISKCYARAAEVIYPPADTSRFTLKNKNAEDYYLAFGALVPYKRFDLAVQAFSKSGRRLIVAGSGPEEQKLKELARGSHVEIRGKVPNDEVARLYQGARAFIFPGEEDFGITPLEAQACGTPVIAFGRGGALETVVEGKTGLFFREQSTQALLKVIEEFEALDWDSQVCRENAQRFSNEIFKEKFTEGILAAFENFSKMAKA